MSDETKTQAGPSVANDKQQTPQLDSREHLIAVAKAIAANPCNCVARCMDAPDEEGVCIGLPQDPEPPYLPEVVLIDRGAVR